MDSEGVCGKEVCSDFKFRRSSQGRSSFEIYRFIALKTLSEKHFYPGCPVQLTGRGLKLYHTKGDYQIELIRNNKVMALSDIVRFSDKRVMAFLPYDLEPDIYYMRYIREYNGKKEHTTPLGFQVRHKEECF
ncbi:MAG: hypothetical protein JXR70_18490 [Spirochaetales bacterium]|nr:hypothetical protein [Spirochaetales bacterium]